MAVGGGGLRGQLSTHRTGVHMLSVLGELLKHKGVFESVLLFCVL